jgi:nucleoid-associated protein YgaU
MSSGTKVFLAVIGLLVGGLVLYYSTVVSTDDEPLEVEKRTAASSTAPGAAAPKPAGETSSPRAAQPPRDRSIPRVARGGERPLDRESGPLTDSVVEASKRAIGGEKSRPDATSEVTPIGTRGTEESARPPVSVPASGVVRTDGPSDGGKGVVELPNLSSLAGDGEVQGPLGPPAVPAVLTSTGRIPVGSATAAQPEAAKAAATESRVPPPVYKDYFVQPGDTMSSIAKHWFGHEGKWDLIARANPLVDPNRLRPGQMLRLPPRETVRPPIAVEGRTAGAAGTAGTGPQTHTVQSGDTLSTIAKAFYGTSARWREIYEANRATIGANPDRLEVGTKLLVPRGR